MVTPTKKEIYDNAKEIFFNANPECEITPTVEELKEGGWWEKAKIEKMMNPETKYLAYQDQIEDEQLEEYESNLEKSTSEYHAKTVEVEINKIIRCPLLPTRSIGDLTKFVKSIRIVGLLAPLILRKSKDKPDFYEIVCGYRRFNAFKEADKEKVEAKVFDELPDEYVFYYSAIENWFHKRHSATEWAIFLDKWKNRDGLTNKNIADILGVTEQAISEYLSLLKLPDEVKNLNAFKFLSLNMGLKLRAIKNSEKQIAIGKEFDKVVKENPHMPQPKLNKELTKIMNKHRKKIPVKDLKEMLIEDLKDMMKRDTSTRNRFITYFIEGCLKAELYEQCYDEAFHYVEIATEKQIADVSLDINFVKDEIVVDINSYREKDSSKWVPFELRFKSYKL